MNIVMMTNAYLPHVGGVANSVHRFTSIYRRLGHRVLVVAPEFEGQPEHEIDVIRMPAIQHFNGSDFAVTLPALGRLKPALDDFEPDIIHSHHPFLIGDTAIRVAAARQIPLVFTHHTMYEQYVHYVPLDAPRLKDFTIAMVTAYANQSDHVIAPSASIAKILRDRGIESPISVVPTGVEVAHFGQGDGAAFRNEFGIGPDQFVVGHVGRLAPEKNLHFLARAVARFCARRDDAIFLVVGSGPSGDGIKHYFERHQLGDRLVMAGVHRDESLVNAYHAMDVFAFSSHSETQGMVLIEAMAAGVPVVALDAPGAREVVQDRRNGRLLAGEDPDEFARALMWIADRTPAERKKLKRGARMTANVFSSDNCAKHALKVYKSVLDLHTAYTDFDESAWGITLNTLREEWRLWSERISIASEVLLSDFTLLPRADSEEDLRDEDSVAVPCPHCAHVLTIPARYVGSTGKCNYCGGRLVIDPERSYDPHLLAGPRPDAETFPYDAEEANLWLWIDHEIRRGVPLQRIVDFIDARRKEIRKDTAAYEVLDQWRRQLREGMLYRNWKARRLEARGDYLAALRLYNENILDQFSGHTPYDRAAIIHARHGEYSRAIDVCERYLAHATDPIQRQRFQRRLRALRRKRDHNSIPTPDADRISAR